MTPKKENNRAKWRALSSKKARCDALPQKIQMAVSAGHEAHWAYPHCRCTAPVREALYRTLEFGEEIPPALSKKIAANIRSVMNRDNAWPKISDWLLKKPHLLLFMYSKYGLDAIDEYTAIRKSEKKKQRPWTKTRLTNIAMKMKKEYGGVPSHLTLKANPTFSAFANQCCGVGQLSNFAEQFNLQRSLKTRPNGFFQTEAGRQEISDIYTSLVVKRGHYINTHYLSSYVKKEEDGVSGKSLRMQIKQTHGSVKNLFLKLIDEGVFPRSWAQHVQSPTTSDGLVLDSYSEVRFYEYFKHFQRSISTDFQNINIDPQPLIGNSSSKGDFLIGELIYVEVLRYSIEELSTNFKPDAVAYKYNLERRLRKYRTFGLNPVLVEPHLLANTERLKDLFIHLAFTVLPSCNSLPAGSVTLSSKNYPGFWFRKKNRDEALQDIVSRRLSSKKGRYSFPTDREMHDFGYGGLLAYYKKMNRTGKLDKQSEAFRNGWLATDTYDRKGASPLRQPTENELSQICLRHKVSKEDTETLIELFGRASLKNFKKNGGC